MWWLKALAQTLEMKDVLSVFLFRIRYHMRFQQLKEYLHMRVCSPWHSVALCISPQQWQEGTFSSSCAPANSHTVAFYSCAALYSAFQPVATCWVVSVLLVEFLFAEIIQYSNNWIIITTTNFCFNIDIIQNPTFLQTELEVNKRLFLWHIYWIYYFYPLIYLSIVFNIYSQFTDN